MGTKQLWDRNLMLGQTLLIMIMDTAGALLEHLHTQVLLLTIQKVQNQDRQMIFSCSDVFLIVYKVKKNTQVSIEKG